jgi:hypothetical protein
MPYIPDPKERPKQNYIDSAEFKALFNAATKADPVPFSTVIYPLCEALLEARKEVLNFLQEKSQQAVYVKRQAEERGQ